MIDMIQEEIGSILQKEYGLSPDIEIRSDKRGMMNNTLYIGDKNVMTIFSNRTLEQVKLISDIISDDTSGFLPEIVKTKSGNIPVIDNRPALMWPLYRGHHYVGWDHSDKFSIPEAGHLYISQAFWSVHQSLSRYADIAGTRLGSVNYLPAPETGEPIIEFSDLPDFLQNGHIVEYLQAKTLPLKYPSLVHHDMERQNFLMDEEGIVLKIVDADSLKRGDILFEYSRCMMNFMFSDPAYKPIYPDYYMSAMLHAGMINPDDIKEIPHLIRAFVAKDLLDYCRYESDPPKTNLSQLAGIYDKCLRRVDDYFSDFSLQALTQRQGLFGYSFDWRKSNWLWPKPGGPS